MRSEAFKWNDVPRKDSKRLINHLIDLDLTEDLGIEWVKGAEIKKTYDNKAIIITKGKNLIEIKLDEKEGVAVLKTNNGKTYYYDIENKKGDLYIYERPPKRFWLKNSYFLIPLLIIGSIVILFIADWLYSNNIIYHRRPLAPINESILMVIILSILIPIALSIADSKYINKKTTNLHRKYGINKDFMFSIIFGIVFIVIFLIITELLSVMGVLHLIANYHNIIIATIIIFLIILLVILFIRLL